MALYVISFGHRHVLSGIVEPVDEIEDGEGDGKEFLRDAVDKVGRLPHGDAVMRVGVAGCQLRVQRRHRSHARQQAVLVLRYSTRSLRHFLQRNIAQELLRLNK